MLINVIGTIIIGWALYKSAMLIKWFEDNQCKGLAWSANREYVWEKVKNTINFYMIIVFITFLILIIYNNN